MRAEAYNRFQRGAMIGGQAKGEAQVKYIKDLTAIAFKLRDSYYTRIVVPDGYEETLQVSDDLLNSLEKTARLLENLQYPRNIVTGSGLLYEEDVFARRVHLTELVILRMSKAIVRESWDWEAKGSPPTPFDYKAWLVSWNRSGGEKPGSSQVEQVFLGETGK
jgi:hypothetical protein